MTFTPGPWKATDRPNDACCWSHHVETEARTSNPTFEGLNLPAGQVADVHGEANARLIAAAPELLEALKTLVYLPDFPPGGKDQVDAAWEAAKTAIAKAEVRS